MPPHRTAPTRSRKVGYDKTTGHDEWLTPRYITGALSKPTPFDCDPCSPIRRPWKTARRHFTVKSDGLKRTWHPNWLMWVNPPYGNACVDWMTKAADHGNALCLVFARTDTVWFHAAVWEHPNTTAVLFLKGRLSFCHVDGTPAGSAGAANVLVAYGAEGCRRLVDAVQRGALAGRIVLLNDGQAPVYRLGVAA